MEAHNQIQNLKVVVVYLGNKMPKYARLNLKYLQETFPDEDIVLISDMQKNLDFAKEIGVETYLHSKLGAAWLLAKQTIRHPLEFRNGFWMHTIARFGAIAEFSKLHPNSPLLHIEADVWLAPSFPMTLFREPIRDLAFSLASPELGSAAVLGIKNYQSARFLEDTSLKEIATNPHSSDMTILHHILQSYPERVEVIPSVFGYGATNGAESELFLSRAGDLENSRFEGLVDPSYWGKFLIGVDPRNHRGRLLLFSQDSNSEVRCDHVDYQMRDGKRLNLIMNGETRELYSMHIHSKNSRMFIQSEYPKLLKRRIDAVGAGPKSKRLYILTMQLSAQALVRRISRLLQKVPTHLLIRNNSINFF